ncbi:aminoglycoside phosphotransferase family protein [Kribbella sp. NBC_01505]|uniref:phosphotransferase enzyme family protein n=1 Tax=Kribbella sp. NBC_01505 TaxID=2903580 RepID=UPI0038693371
MSTSGQVAAAFELGEPEGDLVHIRRGDSDAWRLNTSTGSYFVKGYLGEVSADQLAIATAFEQRALDAGVDMPKPIDSSLGWVTRIDDRLFRVYPWIEAGPTQDVSVWLGQTMARVHQLQPLAQIGLPPWWQQTVPPLTGRPSWASLYDDAVPHLIAIAERIAELAETAPDPVLTHGDFKPHNIVASPTGPMLVDWDSVRTDSAALEAGRVAYTFAAGNPQQINKILTAYVAAGGELDWSGPDLFLSVARHDLQILNDLIQASLGQTPPAPWMGNIETTITTTLQNLPHKLIQLRTLTQGR